QDDRAGIMRRGGALAGATIGFALLYLGSTIALGTPPSAGDSGATVVHWFATHGKDVRTAAWLLTLAAPLFALYAAFVRVWLPVETLTIFGHHGFMAPGGPMNVVLGAVLVAVTLVALGLVVARLEREPVA